MAERIEPYASEIYPSDYMSWRYCIEVKCGVAMTPEYVASRVTAFSDPKSQESKRFAKIHGDAWREQVLTWFQRAAAEG